MEGDRRKASHHQDSAMHGNAPHGIASHRIVLQRKRAKYVRAVAHETVLLGILPAVIGFKVLSDL